MEGVQEGWTVDCYVCQRLLAPLEQQAICQHPPNTVPNDPAPLRQQPCYTLLRGAIWSQDTSVQKLCSDYQLIKSRFRIREKAAVWYWQTREKDLGMWHQAD